MALSYDWGFTNTSIDTGNPSHYALITDEPNKAQYRNVTTPIDQDQIVTYQSDQIGKSMKSIVQVSNPAPANQLPPLMYGIRTDSTLRQTSSLNDDIADMPMVINLTIKHPKHSAFTAARVAAQLELFLTTIATVESGAIKVNQARLQEIMKSSLTN